MSFWLLAGLLCALAVGLLLLPLLRRAAEGAPRQAYDLTVYRDQLAEVERDLERGVLNQDQAAAARTEIERRLLAAAEPAAADRRPARARQPVLLAGGLALGLPAAALGLYLLLGAPGVPSMPLAERPAGGPADMDRMVAQLAARMAAAPEDPQGWRLLARSYGQLGRFQEAADAYRQAIARGGDTAATWAGLGEALTAAAGGLVTPEARQAFTTALTRDPGNPRARYYGGLAYAQDDRLEEALRIWTSLAAESPPDAPWRPLLEQQIGRTRSALGLAGEAPAAPGPSAGDRAAAADMAPEERAAFIRSMVERLATRLESEPDDLDGWLRLTRAYSVLEERGKAAEALARATALAAKLPPDAPEHQAIARARAALAKSE